MLYYTKRLKRLQNKLETLKSGCRLILLLEGFTLAPNDMLTEIRFSIAPAMFFFLSIGDARIHQNTSRSTVVNIHDDQHISPRACSSMDIISGP